MSLTLLFVQVVFIIPQARKQLLLLFLLLLFLF